MMTTDNNSFETKIYLQKKSCSVKRWWSNKSWLNVKNTVDYNRLYPVLCNQSVRMHRNTRLSCFRHRKISVEYNHVDKKKLKWIMLKFYMICVIQQLECAVTL